MRKILILFSFLIPLSGILLAQKPGKNLQTAERFLELVQKDKRSQYLNLCDSAVKSKLSSSELSQFWSQTQEQFGNFKQVKSKSSEIKDGVEIIHQICVFEKMSLDLRITFNAKGLIAGVFLTIPTATGGYKEPPYALRQSFTEENLIVNSGEFRISGTLTVPVGGEHFPLVILVHGSGPNDQDESIGPNKPFKDLAWGLASKHIAVFRYDKRTFTYGSKMAGKPITTKEEVTDDVLAAIGQLKKNPLIDSNRIILIGHSMGGMLMPRLADYYPQLAGIILMAANARPLEELLVEQYGYLNVPKDQINKLQRQINYYKSDSFDLQSPSTLLPLGQPASYWMDLKNYHQLDTYKKLHLPMLVLQGEKDYQVTMQDFGLWKDNAGTRTNITFKSYPGLNHLFMETKRAKSLPADYEIQGNIPEYVITDIANWITKK